MDVEKDPLVFRDVATLFSSVFSSRVSFIVFAERGEVPKRAPY